MWSPQFRGDTDLMVCSSRGKWLNGFKLKDGIFKLDVSFYNKGGVGTAQFAQRGGGAPSLQALKVRKWVLSS